MMFQWWGSAAERGTVIWSDSSIWAVTLFLPGDPATLCFTLETRNGHQGSLSQTHARGLYTRRASEFS